MWTLGVLHGLRDECWWQINIDDICRMMDQNRQWQLWWFLTPRFSIILHNNQHESVAFVGKTVNGVNIMLNPSVFNSYQWHDSNINILL